MSQIVETQTGKLTGTGGVRLFYRGWLPGGLETPKGTVVICHGYAEHSGRYTHVGEYLAGQGFAVWSFDQRGHGQSEGVPVYVERFDLFVEDLHAFMLHIAPPGKTFLYGHSMGSLVALGFAVHFAGLIDGVILSGTLLGAGESVAPGFIWISKLLSVVVPKIPVTALRSEHLSHDPAVVESYDSDPLVNRGKMRARVGAEILRFTEEIKGRLGEIELPILIMHGSADVITDPTGSRMAYDGVSSTDKTLKLWEGMYHEVHNEPAVREAVLALVGEWVDARA